MSSVFKSINANVLLDNVLFIFYVLLTIFILYLDNKYLNVTRLILFPLHLIKVHRLFLSLIRYHF